MVPSTRTIQLNQNPANPEGQFVLYWMTSFRRTRFNFALERAIELANQLRKPLLVFEPLRIGYRWNCDRFHSFVIDGMRDNRQACQKADVEYLPYLEKSPRHGSGLVEKLASKSAAIVTDDYPAFFLPSLLRKFSGSIKCQFEAVDSNGIFPFG